jgi:hypothetical protein
MSLAAFDRDDALYLRDEAEKARHKELELRDAEMGKFTRIRYEAEDPTGIGDMESPAKKRPMPAKYAVVQPDNHDVPCHTRCCFAQACCTCTGMWRPAVLQSPHALQRLPRQAMQHGYCGAALILHHLSCTVELQVTVPGALQAPSRSQAARRANSAGTRDDGKHTFSCADIYSSCLRRVQGDSIHPCPPTRCEQRGCSGCSRGQQQSTASNCRSCATGSTR